MVMVERGPWKWSMDGYLVQNMDLILNKAIPNKWDCVAIIFGKEGSGKSTLATQLCAYTDPGFDMPLCVFTPQQFLKVCDECREKSAIQWDEAISGATAQQQGNEISQAIISRLTTIRKKRLKIFVCFPYLHMLNKYFVSRCLFSVFVYAKGFDKRGYMKYYNQRKTEVLYELMKNKYIYSPLTAIRKVTPNFFCNFPDQFCLPEKEYDRLKEASTKIEVKPNKYDMKWRSKLVLLLNYMKKKHDITQTELGEAIGMPKGNISVLMRSELAEDDL